MSPLATFLKGRLLSLPEPLLGPLRKARALGAVRGFSEGEEPDLRVVRDLVSPGDTVIDVGANIGCYTRYLSEGVGPRGRVRSVEPIPVTFEILRTAVRRLGLENVELFNCALHESDGWATMEVPPYTSGGVNFYQARFARAPATSDSVRFHVEVRTIDSLLGGERDWISFVKVDVEGVELACLQGASGILARSHPAWLIEVSGNPDEPESDARSLFELLAAGGYAAFWYDGRRLRERKPGDRSVNYFFLTERHTKRLGHHFSPS